MDIEKLRYFCVVSETQSLRKASELLHLSPAALSKAIKKLEGDLNTKLILPEGRGITISDEGKEIALRGKAILEQISLFDKGITERKNIRKPVRLGSFEVFTTYFLGPLMKKIPEEASLVLYELIPGHMEKALIEGRIDLGVTYLPVPQPEIEFLKVATLEMGIYALKGRFDEYHFSEIPFAVPVEPVQGVPTKVQGLDGWPDDKIPRNIRYRVTLMESAMELCRQGHCASYLPHFIVRLHNERILEKYRLSPITLPAGIKTKQPVYLVKKRHSQENKIHQRVASVLRAELAIPS
jgi:DNA-binding transcriptional LysR family regulator